MTLKALKESLSKFGSDDDSLHVMILGYDDKGERVYSIVSSVSMARNMPIIFLAGEEATLKLVEENVPRVQDETPEIYE